MLLQRGGRFSKLGGLSRSLGLLLLGVGGHPAVVEEQLLQLLLHHAQLLQSQFVFDFQLCKLGTALVGQLLLQGLPIQDRLVARGELGLQHGHLHRRNDQRMERQGLIGIRQWQITAKQRRPPCGRRSGFQGLEDIPVRGRHPIKGFGQQDGQFGLRGSHGGRCLGRLRALVRQTDGCQHRPGLVGIDIDKHQSLPESRPPAQQLAVQRQPCIGRRRISPHLPRPTVEPEDPGLDPLQRRPWGTQHRVRRPVNHMLSGAAAGRTEISAVVGRQPGQDDGGLLHVDGSSRVGGQ